MGEHSLTRSFLPPPPHLPHSFPLFVDPGSENTAAADRGVLVTPSCSLPPPPPPPFPPSPPDFFRRGEAGGGGTLLLRQDVAFWANGRLIDPLGFGQSLQNLFTLATLICTG